MLATRFAKDPVAIALVVALLVLATLVFFGGRRKEGWTYDPNGKATLSDGAKRIVAKRCSEGWQTETFQQSDKYDYLGKYKMEAVKATCIDAFVKRSNDAETNVQANYEKSKKCKHGACPNEFLRETHPCLNGNLDKCCKVDGSGKMIKGECLKARKAMDEIAESNKKDIISKYTCEREKCPQKNLVGVYPCLNWDGTKCCRGKTCVKLDNPI